ncbi:hypothetical protein TUMSATVNIG1_24220 [Vibrio nigripulchritudo]|nr:hypothetical protein VNTUMSATTG_23970 [Vibrio nigripulchritudo]BDU31813.1 hypothetical protein TUMSATVNIG1_24220 [Vibrio nigripulchritudo]
MLPFWAGATKNGRFVLNLYVATGYLLNISQTLHSFTLKVVSLDKIVFIQTSGFPYEN